MHFISVVLPAPFSPKSPTISPLGSSSSTPLRAFLPEYDFFRFYRTRMHSAIMDYDAILWHLRQYFSIDGAELDWKTVNTLVELPYYVDFDEFICTHSGIPLADPDEVIWEDVLQGDFDECAPSVCEGKCVLFSHTSAKEGDDDRSIVKYPSEGGKSIADHYKIKLDTNVHTSGVLGCFRADDCASFYVSKQ